MSVKHRQKLRGIVIGTLEHIWGVHHRVYASTYTLGAKITLMDGPEGFVKPHAVLHSNGTTKTVECELCYQATPSSVEIRNRDGLYIVPPMTVYVAVTASSTRGDYIEWFFVHGNKRYSGLVETAFSEPTLKDLGVKPVFPSISI